jgi:lysozyme
MPVVNDAALDLICEFEGFIDHWYPDPAHGWKVPTCCYGHTDAAGEPKYAKTKDKRFTKAEGRLILERDLAQYAAQVRTYVKAPLNEDQFGALVSFTYNLGSANLLKSTLLKKLNKGDYEGAAREFYRWNRAGGKIMKGLVRRRAAEADLFRSRAPASAPPPEAETPASEPRNVWAALFQFIAGVVGALLKGLGKK